MKIFISHSSKNSNYGNALVNLLTGVGVNADKVIFTSNDAYGIPIGNNIFDWLKNRINEKPYVLYLLSPEYYKSVACLNEMGAAWVIENKHTMIFTPDFKLDSYEFRNGAIDPREIGFFINNYDKLIAFVESLKPDYSITTNPVIISQKIREFLSQIESFKSTIEVENIEPVKEVNIKVEPKSVKSDNTLPQKYTGNSRFLKDLTNNKLKDEEILLAHYIIDEAKFNLYTGWQESQETDSIKIWEDINEINNTLSENYDSAIRRFGMKKLTEVFAVTESGNTKEVKITEEFQEELLDPSPELENRIEEVIKNNPKIDSEVGLWS